jgi:Tfp pilus assembly protein FimT
MPRSSSVHSDGAAGTTLLELLCVVCVLALASGVLLHGFGRAATALTPPPSLEQLVASIDAEARLGALRGQPLEITATTNGLVVRNRHTHAVVMEQAVSATVLEDPRTRGTMETIPFDAAGRTTDYVVACRTSAGIERVSVCGVTGWIEPIGAEDAP